MIALAAALVACKDLEHSNMSSMPVGQISPSLSMQSPSVAFLAAKTKAGEMLIAATEADLPLTNQTFYEGKFLTAANTVTGRAYTKAGLLLDAATARKAEHAAHRAKYGAWPPAVLKQLDAMPASKQVSASLWVSFFLPDSAKTLASLGPLAAVAKAPVKQAMAQSAVTTLWDDPHSPLLLVKGKATAARALGFHPAVDTAETIGGPLGAALGDPGDGQEKIDAHMSDLVASHGNLTNDSVILQWDVRLPGTEVTQHVDLSGREQDKMAYIPLNLSRSFTNNTQSECNTTNLATRKQCSHVARSLGIIAGRRDTQYSPARGFDSYLPRLTSIGVATLQDVDAAGGYQRIAAVAASSPRPDVQSWSMRLDDGPYYLSNCSNVALNTEKYVDYWSVVRPSLNVMAVGNHAPDDDIDCDWTANKIRNGIVVGGFYDGNVVPAEYKMFTATDDIDGYSSWRSPYSPTSPGYDHGDRRHPHLSAVGTFVQSVDQYWRFTASYPPCVGSPYTEQYQRCDAPTDQPTYNAGGCDTVNWAGTSFSAPQAAAIAAYAVREAKCVYNTDWLKAIEAARALVIAAATRNITVRSLGSQDAVWPLVTGQAQYNERKWAAGAGGIDASSLSWILHSKCTRPGQPPGGSWGGFDFYFDPDNPPGPKSKAVWVPSGQGNARCRVAIAWNPTTSCGTGSNPQCTEGQGYDFDVCLRRNATGQWIGCASSWDNNYEYLNVPCYANEGYTVEILPYWGTSHTTAKVGMAFMGTWE